MVNLMILPSVMFFKRRQFWQIIQNQVLKMIRRSQSRSRQLMLDLMMMIFVVGDSGRAQKRRAPMRVPIMISKGLCQVIMRR